ncbi:hypothetical protein DO021_16570 [Desulfobacter hydrogenophilus]|uniref:Uncharacterized protein n=1 Tax=Desulfobacter hydrogenophilus TaxID=2291 RepID=A0A328F896_9BACT|nr:hypothetical protein [Desulfobacter hydrogenophilus]NDY73030.1 hypothetical protein [Desulfobacter hydrogenophilus]QBH14717.1 hypothetical protein EYB58_18415 [Desulfobacter hydrogenophilus]RAM00878.1 hypothetical protein DO021_16570 [Desulfobacter hydrogenophilus]
MPRLSQKKSKHTHYLQFISDPARLAKALADTEPTEQLTAWLNRLKRLYGVPFNYLVPNEKMLPNESIRFFQVDFNWIDALLEGACSIGHANETEARHAALLTAKLHAACGMTGATGNISAPTQVTGFLLRSQVVSGWPKLEVVAYGQDGTELTNVLRMEHISPSLLLYLVEGKIDHLLLREPAVGLHFGIDINGEKNLRYVTVPADAPAGTKPGDQMAVEPVPPTFRDKGNRTLKLNQLAANTATTLYANQANNAPDGSKLPFTSAEFALEMVEGTQEVEFQSNGSQ